MNAAIPQREPARVAPAGAPSFPAPAGVTGAGDFMAVSAQADALVGSARQADRCELSTVLCPSGYSATFAEYEKTPDAGDQHRPLPPYSNTPAAAYAAEDWFNGPECAAILAQPVEPCTENPFVGDCEPSEIDA